MLLNPDCSIWQHQSGSQSKDESSCLASNIGCHYVLILQQSCFRPATCQLLTCTNQATVDTAKMLCRLVSAVTQRLAGGIIGLLEAVLLKFYQYVVDPAEPGTWPIRFFTWAATGPIK